MLAPTGCQEERLVSCQSECEAKAVCGGAGLELALVLDVPDREEAAPLPLPVVSSLSWFYPGPDDLGLLATYGKTGGAPLLVNESMWLTMISWRPSFNTKFLLGVSKRKPMSSLPKTLESLQRSARSPCPLASFLSATAGPAIGSEELRAVELVGSLAIVKEGTLENTTVMERSRLGSKL